ncbi:hypothetical protein L6164_013183 [Bauhinia variegata]|uniref:Uncharacterized protein n=1 Tax=Bauhinia variegata TaxID=167791 RepID=A0ACB9PBT6_BAUVA|nr:hypothetical protein L6164_013183 [Bauhinia variegata]
MPTKRQSFFSCAPSLVSCFLFFTILLCNPAFSANNEASLLFSWLHMSASPPSSFFSNWNMLDSKPLFLRKLVVSDANLTGPIPDDIGNCSSLTVIDLRVNNLIGSIPASIGNLQNLQRLILNSNQLSGGIPVELSNCIGLKSLVLYSNKLDGVIPPVLGKLSRLAVLRVGANMDITGKIPDELGNCTNLTQLRLSLTSISGSIPSELGKLQKLQTLLLLDNSLSGAIPEEIGNCTSLKFIEFSLNSLSGAIPLSICGLSKLEGLMINDNSFSGSIPSSLSNVTNLQSLVLNRNKFSGLIPPELGMLSKLSLLYLWQNQLEGIIPSSLANCTNLQFLDFSFNELTGAIPDGLFQLQNLKLMLIKNNDISGTIPPGIGNCSSLERLLLENNHIYGEIPKTIGNLKNLNYCDVSWNYLSGPVPDEMGNCTKLELLDLSNNRLEGALPSSLQSLSKLQSLNASFNGFLGQIPAFLCHIDSLEKLILSSNSFSGPIPLSLGLCLRLKMLDLSSNQLNGSIPAELGHIQSLGIALNLSCNSLSESIPAQISALKKLTTLDISHNMLEGSLCPLAGLVSLVSLNVSCNNFNGSLPDTDLFRDLSAKELRGNQGLDYSHRISCFLSDSVQAESTRSSRKSLMLKVAIGLLVVLTVVLITIGIISIIMAQRTTRDEDSGMGSSWPWQFIPFQNLNFSVEQILRCLVDRNIIGEGFFGVVYRADMDNGQIVAVKKLRPAIMTADDECEHDKRGVLDSFTAEVKTLGSIRHKNIVRFLGCCWNRCTTLLMYDYMPNGSLGSLLHESNGDYLEWGLRYKILLGAAQGLAYLHHDCVPPIVHRDIKPNNILIDSDFEAHIADFGLAKLLDDSDFAGSSEGIAGSYGYIAPEYGYMMKITKKSDVYSFEVVLLEVLMGEQPNDPTIPDGLNVVDWVKQKRGEIEVLDPRLPFKTESEINEMMQVLGIALLCVNSVPGARPAMKEVAAMLKEIKHGREEYAEIEELLKGSSAIEAREKKDSTGIASTSSKAPATQSLNPNGNV